MYRLVRPLLFKIDPEVIHHITLVLMRLAGAMPPINTILCMLFSNPGKRVDVLGMSFKNQIGLAAGFDKDGISIRGLAGLGFGHIEIGTVTLKPQAGNLKPRLFRLPEDKALINRMGFPSRGAEYVLKRLEKINNRDIVIGVNIGKNLETPLEEAPVEYVKLLRLFSPAADYIAVNVSSPNTVGLRRLQAREALDGLLKSIDIERAVLPEKKPVLVKLAPDLTEPELTDALDIIIKNNIDGVIATNTTIARSGLQSAHRDEAGGLSGAPLHPVSVAMVEKIHHLTAGKLPIIGVGGAFNGSSIQQFLDAGAVLVQIYTGLVYEGPSLVKRIIKELE